MAKEFKKYREENQFWTTYIKEINYQFADEEMSRVRIIDGIGSKPEVFYCKKYLKSYGKRNLKKQPFGI